ncbi:nucleoside deoxyribosyltransferase [Aminobacter phage Erebus]|nr:nucleoside deoxyribosyltransferase [Aminobacter phage Erebus]
MKTTVIYLAGPITGSANAKGWREAATDRLLGLGFEVINPMLIEASTMDDHEVVKLDFRAVLKSSALLVDARRPSWGTAMEVLFAFQTNIPVIAWGVEDPAAASPWLRHHAYFTTATLDGALFELGAMQ